MKTYCFCHFFCVFLRKCLKSLWFWSNLFQKAWKHYTFSSFSLKVYQNEHQKVRFEAFRPWLHKSTKWAPEGSIWCILALAPEVDKISSRRFDLRHSGLGSTSRQNELQKGRFEHFQALAPEVDKMSSRRVDLSIFRPWLQKSTKWAPEGSIWGIPALAPEVDKMSSRRLDLNIFRPVSIGCPQITIFLIHEAIGCQQKHDAFDICVDRMPANNDTFNTWGDRMPAKTQCFWYLCR